MHIIRFSAGAWRARLGDGFNSVNIARAADALGVVWADAHPGATVLVGYGTHRGAARHAQLAASVMAAYGLHVVVADGPVPLPAVAWTAAHDSTCVGLVMVSASGAPATWGGMVVRGSDGGPVSSGLLSAFEHAVSGDAPHGRGPVAFADLAAAYRHALLAQVNTSLIAQHAPLVVGDALYGAARCVLTGILTDAGGRVIALHDGDDDTYAGLIPEPFEPWVDACEQLVVSSGATCGIVVSGDGARAGLVDERGRIVDAHSLVALLLGHLVARGGAARGRVVTTTASSERVRRQGERLGCEVTVVPVGFNRVYGEVLEGDVLLAAEEYGGICLPTHLYERDGLLVGLLALELLAKDGRPLSTLVSELERAVGHMVYGRRDIQLDAAQIQSLRNVLPGLNPARLAGRAPVAVSHGDGLRLRFDDDSWVMLRPARTQAAVRIYAEAPSTEQRDELIRAAHELAQGQL